MLEFAKRDKNIIRDLAKCRILSINQIRNAYWKTVKDGKESLISEQNVWRRLKALCDHGVLQHKKLYIETSPGSGSYKMSSIFSLTPKAARAYNGKAGFLNMNELHHDLAVGDKYLELPQEIRSTFKIYYKTKALKKFNGYNPDYSYRLNGEEVLGEIVTVGYRSPQIQAKKEAWASFKVDWTYLQDTGKEFSVCE